MKLKDVLKIMIQMRVKGSIMKSYTSINLFYREALEEKSFHYQDLKKNRELLDVEIDSIISIETNQQYFSIESITFEVKE